MTGSDIHDRAVTRWIIIGYGRVGQSLRLLAERLDATVVATWNRTKEAARRACVDSPNPHWGQLPDALEDVLDEPCVIWLTVVDQAILPVFETIEPFVSPGSMIVHTSGSHPSTLLSGHTEHPAASLHPLQAISEPETAVERFQRTFWTIEGDDRAVDVLTPFLAPAGIEPTRIKPDQKTLYHASAVVSANLLVSLMDAAISIAESTDIDRPTARAMLVELAESSLDNLASQPAADALTGPAARGDTDVIDAHRRALDDLDDDTLIDIYDVLTDRALHQLAAHDD